MGTWGPDTFENDTAADWQYGLEGIDDLSLVRETLEGAITSGEVFDSDIACEALAACEVIARLRGNWGRKDAYSEDLDAWVTNHPQQIPADLIAIARRVIDSILREDSELRALWDESGEASEWLKSVEDLKQRATGE